jgi:prepilin-type N-terminal cleavage/methylation domain-containing protein
MTGRRGFSLMEVLIVLSLLVLLSGSMFGFLWNLTRNRDRLISLGRDGQAGGVVIERIENDLFCGIAGSGGVAGVEGDTSRLKILTRGVWMPGEAEGQGARALGDLQGTELVFSGGVLRATRWVGGDGGGEAEVVSDRIADCRIRYFDGREWVETFDSQAAGRLPAAVEVSLWFGEGAASRPADRRRVVVVPDGPQAAWKEGS